ncbi:MAG: hypothetical protein KDA65_09375 [Planctomycetaceae bacterium]|nr:hypothetical protein [Planctomycetaceae bacterium]
MTKLEFELTIGDVIECGDVELLVVEVDDNGVHFKIKTPFETSPLEESSLASRLSEIPR